MHNESHYLSILYISLLIPFKKFYIYVRTCAKTFYLTTYDESLQQKLHERYNFYSIQYMYIREKGDVNLKSIKKKAVMPFLITFKSRWTNVWLGLFELPEQKRVNCFLNASSNLVVNIYLQRTSLDWQKGHQKERNLKGVLLSHILGEQEELIRDEFFLHHLNLFTLP